MVSSSSSETTPTTAATTTLNYDPNNLVAQSWTSAAGGYNELFVPRFQPWTSQCLQLLREEFGVSSFEVEGHDDFAAAAANDECDKAVAFIPCCGPGQELVPVSDIVAPYPVLGMDIAPGMVQVAQTRIEDYYASCSTTIHTHKNNIPEQDIHSNENHDSPIKHHHNIQVIVGDCGCGGRSERREEEKVQTPKYCVVFSIFGLQQMVDPLATFKQWISNLVIGGIAVICFWPPGGKVETDPHALWGPTLRQLLQQHTATVEKDDNNHDNTESNSNSNDDSNQDATNNNDDTCSSTTTLQETPHQQQQQHYITPPPTTALATTATTTYWDEDIVKVAKEAGAEIVHDFEQSHEITWQSPLQFWDAMTNSGPWHKLRLTKGNKYVDGVLKEEFFSVMFAKDNHREVLSHSPCARILVLRKRSNVYELHRK